MQRDSGYQKSKTNKTNNKMGKWENLEFQMYKQRDEMYGDEGMNLQRLALAASKIQKKMEEEQISPIAMVEETKIEETQQLIEV